ncbi:hypothetical protein IAU60_001273 [Kwoniella sp. DSM 27419]
MKRLFRNSKSPVVDPLPAPPLSAPASGTSTPASHHHEPHSRWFGLSHQSEVTPYPVDAGREPAASSGGQKQTPPQVPSSGRKGKERVSSGQGGHHAPSLLEIQQMQDREQAMRPGPSTPSRQHPVPQPRRSRGDSNPPRQGAPDGWPTSSNGFDPPYRSSTDTDPLPIPQAAFVGSPNQPSSHSPSSATTALYLPPGARPATPPSVARPPYASTNSRHSQSSLNSLTGPQYGNSGRPNDDMYNMAPQPIGGRERGHSIASATGSVSARSDHESNLSASHAHGPFPSNTSNNGHAGASPSKLQKPMQLPHPSRSPLVNSYNPMPDPSSYTAFPAPRPYSQTQAPPVITQSNPTPTSETTSNPFAASLDETPSMQQSNAVNLARRGSQADHGKEKKRGFWGMNWSKGKDKDKDKERREGFAGIEEWPRQSMEDPDRSMEAWRADESQPSSTQGHSMSHGHEHEEVPRGRLLGLDFGGGKKEKDQHPHQANDVTSAIHMLCTMPDPPHANIYEVCDRINQSHDNDSIAKEAARALRKEFKHGSEGERRNAAKVWLLLMRNVSVRGFRPNASNRKFFASIEPIFLAPSNKPLVSVQTHRLLTDILADLTFSYGMEKGCEGLMEMWKKVKLPQEPDFGNPLPADHPIFNSEPAYRHSAQQPQATPPHSLSASRHPSSPSLQHLSLSQHPPRGPSPGHFGPGYANLPNHGEDIRRLVDECTAARESARVLTEALVYTRPEELEHKPIIGEFYRKVFLAHESLTNQMDWAQAEAQRSHERHGGLTLDGNPDADNTHGDTPEEQALANLFEAHSALAEALRQHDEMERIAAEDREMREVRERSKKDTRMDRNQQIYAEGPGGLAPPGGQIRASGSRSPSPSRHAPLPVTAQTLSSSPRKYDSPMPLPGPPRSDAGHPFKGPYTDSAARSRTPSPDARHPLPQPPKIPGSPGHTRASSPLGRVRMGGPRPLPNPFAKNASQASLANAASGTATPGTGTATSGTGTGAATPALTGALGTGHNPSRSGTGDTTGSSAQADQEEDGDNLPPVPLKPSRKALGKRRAVVDTDNNFDPNDMFNPNPTDPRARPKANSAHGDSDSDDSLTAESNLALLNAKPVVYAYDAYEERQKEMKRAEEALRRSGGSGSGSAGGAS